MSKAGDDKPRPGRDGTREQEGAGTGGAGVRLVGDQHADVFAERLDDLNGPRDLVLGGADPEFHDGGAGGRAVGGAGGDVGGFDGGAGPWIGGDEVFEGKGEDDWHTFSAIV